MIQKNHVLLGSAAALMLLAGCGNGPDATSLSGQHSTKAPGSPVTATAQQGGQGRATPMNAQDNVATKAPAQAPAFTDDSISAELLATLLVINTHEAGRHVIEQATGPSPTGRLHHAPRAPSLQSYQRIQRHSDESGRYQMVVFSRGPVEAYTYFDQTWKSKGVGVQIVVNEGEGYHSTRAPFDFSDMGGKPAGTELLRMLTDLSSENIEFKSATGKPYVLRIGDRLPLNSVLHRWKGDKGESVDLVVMKGTDDREIRTCFNVKAGAIRYLLCGVWNIPENWAFPNGINRFYGHSAYLMDDRRAVPNAGHVLYWQSRSASALPQRLPQGRKTPIAYEPISRLGVSGDVFATMLASGQMLFNIQAQPATGPVPYGSLMTNPDKPNILAKEHNTGFGIPGSWGSHGLHTQLATERGAYQYMPYAASMGLTWRLKRNTDGIPDLSNPIAPDAELVNLTHNMQTQWQQPGSFYNSLVLHPSYAFSVRKDRLVPFSFRLQRWHTKDGQLADLMLLRGVRPDQARLCTHLQLKVVKRLQCADWQVPAGWTLGQPLKPLGVSVVDTRSVYPGESGYHYWMTAAMSK